MAEFKLFLDTSNRKIAEVKLIGPSGVVSEKKDNRNPASQVLLPLIDKIVKENGISYKDIAAIEVHTGPGSYTGLKVGAAVANALGFYLKIPVNGKIGIPVTLLFD